eukprot:SAG31_NODE_55_length_29938_cov_9.154027_13_plen_755_part_00
MSAESSVLAALFACVAHSIIRYNREPSISCLYLQPFLCADEANNNNPVHFRSFTGDRPGHPDVTLCTDLLINGHPWNQSFISVKPTPWDRGYNNCFGSIEVNGTSNCSIVGQLGADFPVYGVTYTGNTHDPPSKAAAPSCTSYAAIFAVGVVGLTASGNTMTDCLPSMAPLSGALLHTGTDSAQYLATDVNLIGNAVAPAYENPRENYGWWPLIELAHPNRSLHGDTDPAGCHGCRGELPLHTFFSPELPQRNFYHFEQWTSLDSAQRVALPVTTTPHNGYDGLASVLWGHSSKHTEQSALIASYYLDDDPSLAGQPVYFALRWKPAVNNSALSLLIDAGDGNWQTSNATGLVCNRHIVAACHTPGADSPAVAGQWRLRVYSGTMKLHGTARFGLRLRTSVDDIKVDTSLSGIVIAPIGARYQTVAGLKTDDLTTPIPHGRRRDKRSWKHAVAWRSKLGAPPSPSPPGRLNAKDFGAVGDGHADDTAALQRAIDAAQKEGKALFVPGGSYGLSKPLFVHCCNAWCANGFRQNITYRGLVMAGAGEFLTYLFVRADAHRLQSILLFESHRTSKEDPNVQPAFNTSVQNQITDLSLSGGATEGWQNQIPAFCGGSGPDADASHCGADYGIYGPGLTWSLFQRVSVYFVRLAAMRMYYCWYNRVEDCNFRQSQIGLHSACNNMRISGTNIDMQDIAGVMIDGGASIDIVGNLIEGNGGPGIILSAGIWGAPNGITIQSNYCKSSHGAVASSKIWYRI